MAAPCVSVLMPVCDGERYLEEAIRSILDQTFRDWEFIVINDGSTDGTAEIIERYRLSDPRIRVYEQPRRGLVAALNRGLTLARGAYIARMDADDVSLPDRLAVQIAFMESHPTVGVCGTWIETFGVDHPDVRRYPADDAMIRSWMLFESVLAHPSVMMRREVVDRHGLSYDAAARHAEDYDLWVRAARHTDLANIPLVLLRYRSHPQQVVKKHETTKRESARRIRLTQLHSLGLAPDDDELTLHEALGGWEFTATRDFITAAHTWLMKLISANQSTGVYPAEALHRTLGLRWAALCASATHLGFWTWRTFRRSPLQVSAGFNWKQRLKFGVKCGIRKKQHA